MNKTAGIYLHFPFCKIKCGYCDFYSIIDREDSIPEFIDCMIEEIDTYFDIHDTSEFTFNSIFLGGGTPSIIPASYIEKLFDKLSKRVDFSKIKEITIEANPGESPRSRLREYRELGVNRVSFGFQSLNDDILKFLDRLHSKNQCISAFHDAREAGFTNINADMIFNIPGQSIQILKENIDSLIELSPEHISCYSLTVERGTKLYYRVKNGSVKMPSEEQDYQMYKNLIDRLIEKNYTQYEVSNFCKEDRECIHNLHYWELDPYLAFGPSAHGFNGKKRWWNYRSLDKYIEVINSGKLPIQSQETLTRKNRINELIMNGLRTSNGVKINNLKELGYQLKLKEATEKWSDLIEDRNHLKLRNSNYMLLDEITADLFV